MVSEPPGDRLRDLEKRIDTLKKATAPEPRAVKDFGAADMGWRMVIELVSGLGIGAAVGYGLDVLFGTLPVFLVVLTLLGFVAGVKVMLKTAKELQNANAGGAAAGSEGDKDGRRD